MAMKTASAAAIGNPSSATSGARRRTLEIVTKMKRVEKDGRTNRCR